MKAIEEKIRNKQYSTLSIANAVVKRADISPQARNKLLELADKVYNAKPQPDHDPLPSDTIPKLDAALMRISYQLLVLCVEHKISRDEIHKKLESWIDRVMTVNPSDLVLYRKDGVGGR